MYVAAEKVWNVLSQPWSAWPRSSLFLGVNFKELMLSVTVDRFLEIPARRWLTLESLSSAVRLGMRLKKTATVIYTGTPRVT